MYRMAAYRKNPHERAYSINIKGVEFYEHFIHCFGTKKKLNNNFLIDLDNV